MGILKRSGTQHHGVMATGGGERDLWFGEHKGPKGNLTVATGRDETDSGTVGKWVSHLES